MTKLAGVGKNQQALGVGIMKSIERDLVAPIYDWRGSTI